MVSVLAFDTEDEVVGQCDLGGRHPVRGTGLDEQLDGVAELVLVVDGRFVPVVPAVHGDEMVGDPPDDLAAAHSTSREASSQTLCAPRRTRNLCEEQTGPAGMWPSATPGRGRRPQRRAARGGRGDPLAADEEAVQCARGSGRLRGSDRIAAVAGGVEGRACRPAGSGGRTALGPGEARRHGGRGTRRNHSRKLAIP